MSDEGELDNLLSDIAKVSTFPSDLDALRATRALLAGAEFEHELAETTGVRTTPRKSAG